MLWRDILDLNVDVKRDVAQLGSALRSGRRGRWFESSHPDFLVSIVKLFVAVNKFMSFPR